MATVGSDTRWVRLMLAALLAALVVGGAGAEERVAQAAEPADLPADLPVMGIEETTFEKFHDHLTVKNPDVDWYYARRIFEIYFEECRLEGVSLVVALSQMIHETDFLLFSGAVRAVQYNYAGLGATSVGAPGLSFPNMRTGVRAHVQHLKAYGTNEPLRQPLVDPRFGYVERGSAESVQALTGRWAVDPGYGPKVIAHAHRLLVRKMPL